MSIRTHTFMFALLMTLALALGQSRGSAGTVIVTADQTVNGTYSSAGDLITAMDYFHDATRPSAGLGAYAPIAQGLQATRLRIFSYTSDLDANQNFVADGNLYWGLIDAKNNSLYPHVIVGHRKPPSFPNSAWNWDAATWTRYQDFANKFIVYTMDSVNGGFTKAWFEVGNEWDICAVGDTQDCWLLGSWSPQGSLDRYNAYYKLYKVWADAIQSYATAHPTKTLICGGPASTTGSCYNVWGSNGPNFLSKLATDCKTDGKRFDVLTFHLYGDFAAVGNGPACGTWPSFKQQLWNIRSWENAAGWASGSSWRGYMMTEWGQTVYESDGQRGRMNYDMKGSAWGAACLKDCMDGMLSCGGAYLRFDDGALTNLGMSHLDANGTIYPKPIYNLCRMIQLMPGLRKAVATPIGQPNLGAIASCSATAASLLLYNYKYTFTDASGIPVYQDNSAPEYASVTFNNLPFTGAVTIRRYLIDYTHSNIAYYYDRGLTPDSNGCALQKVEEYAGTVSGGVLNIGQITLDTSGTTLWTVSK